MEDGSTCHVVIDAEDVVAYAIIEELMCTGCATQEEVDEWGEDAEALVTRKAVEHEESNDRKLYCDRFGGRTRPK
jgi:hypothetical protein